MSAFKGTPGPWFAGTQSDGSGWVDIYIPSYSRNPVASATPAAPGDAEARRDHETLANAHLIAAAPELLEALMQLVERISYYAELKEEGIPNIEDWACTYNSGDMQRAKEAIKKATGGAA